MAYIPTSVFAADAEQQTDLDYELSDEIVSEMEEAAEDKNPDTGDYFPLALILIMLISAFGGFEAMRRKTE